MPRVSSSKGDESPGARGTGGRLLTGVELGSTVHQGFTGNFAGRREIGQVEAAVQKWHCGYKGQEMNEAHGHFRDARFSRNVRNN